MILQLLNKLRRAYRTNNEILRNNSIDFAEKTFEGLKKAIY